MPVDGLKQKSAPVKSLPSYNRTTPGVLLNTELALSSPGRDSALDVYRHTAPPNPISPLRQAWPDRQPAGARA